MDVKRSAGQRNRDKVKGEDMELTKMYGELGISEKVLNYGREIEKSLHDRFEAIDKTAEYNQLKVIKAMQEARVRGFPGMWHHGRR